MFPLKIIVSFPVSLRDIEISPLYKSTNIVNIELIKFIMRKLFNITNESLSELIDEFVFYLDMNKIEGILSIKNYYIKNANIIILALNIILLNKPDLLVCVLKRQIEKGLTATQIATLRILTVYLNDCQRKGYF